MPRSTPAACWATQIGLTKANNPQGIRTSMAARINKRHTDEVRQRIQTSQLINVLQEHALTGEGDFPMSRMKAIEILLKKRLPDLSSVELTGEDGGPMKVETIRRVIVDPIAKP